MKLSSAKLEYGIRPFIKISVVASVFVVPATAARAGDCVSSGVNTVTCSNPANVAADVQQTLTVGAGGLTVTTQSGFGIDTSNIANGRGFLINGSGDLTLLDLFGSDVTADREGITVGLSSGALSLDWAGNVTTNTWHGLLLNTGVTNGSAVTSQDVTLRGDVDAGRVGVLSRNRGSGTSSITIEGNVKTHGSGGVYSFTYGARQEIVISAGSTIDAGLYGVLMAHGASTGGETSGFNASGDTVAVVNGTITTSDHGAYFGPGTGQQFSYRSGLYLHGNSTTDNLLVSGTGDITGNDSGIAAYNEGTGRTEIINSGTVTSHHGDGIEVRNNGTSLTVSVNNVTGQQNGIHAINNGTGDSVITVDGVVSGTSGTAIQTETGVGGLTRIILNSGADVRTGSTTAISNNDGDSVLTINSGAKVTGGISLGDGDDQIVVAGGDISGVTLFDGGDDNNVADTFVDILTFQGSASHTVAGSNIVNFEQVVIDQSDVTMSDGSLNVGELGLSLQNGGSLSIGNMAFTLTGNLSNSGVVRTQNGAAGDLLTVTGDYVGGGMLALDVDFMNDVADALVVAGSISNVTTVLVDDVSGVATSGGRVRVVDSQGVSPAGAFVLSNSHVINGAYTYSLEQDGVDRDWYLTAVVNGTGVVYEALPLVLSDLNRLPTLEQRSKQRNSTRKSPFWLRFTGGWLDATPTDSATGLSYESTTWGLQAGVDLATGSTEAGEWVAGASLQYNRVLSRIESAFGAGDIKAQSYGVGAFATWHGQDGWYADLQSQLNWISSDISSSASGMLATGHTSAEIAVGFEVGRHFALPVAGSLTPQAQLIWSYLSGDQFTDTTSTVVAPGGNDRLISRIGLTYNLDLAERGNIHVSGNLWHEASADQTTRVGNSSFSVKPESTWLEFGVGGKFKIDPDQLLYAEASYTTSLGGRSSDNNALTLSAGFKMTF